ncbi:MAG: O-antigen ligase family protein [Sumerlaeia bacterium]
MPDSAASVLRWVAFGILAAVIGLAPAIFWPIGEGGSPSVSPPLQLAKSGLIRYGGAAILLVCAALLVGDPLRHWLRARLGVLLLAALLLWAGFSILLSPNSGLSLNQYLNQAMLIAVAALTPLFLRTGRQVWVLLACSLAGSVVVAAVVWLAVAGFTSITQPIYGSDPLAMLEQGADLAGSLEGGRGRAAAISTLGNPEYTGSFLAAAFLLAGCLAMDGWGSRRAHRWGFWAGLLLMAFLGGAALLSESRTVAVIVAAGLLARWLLSTSFRGVTIVSVLSILAVSGVLMGPAAVLVPGSLILFAAVVIEYRRGHLNENWTRLDARIRKLFLFAPVVLLLGLLAVATVSPLRVRAVRYASRFAESDSSDRSVRMRLVLFMLAGEMALQDPVFGAGPGFYGPRYFPALDDVVRSDASGTMAFARLDARTWFGKQAHNDFLQMAAELGVPYLALFLALLTWVFWRLSRIARAPSPDAFLAGLARALAVTLVGYMAMMLSSFPLDEGARTATFWGLVAAAVGLIAIAAEQSEAPPA